MPELPEVQTIVNGLKKKIIGRKIIGVWFDAPKLIKKPKAAQLEGQIKGLKITRVERLGKNILIFLAENLKLKAKSYLLLVHPKMTGHFLIGRWKIEKGKVKSLVKGAMQDKVNNYIHVIFSLDNGRQLAFSDLRKFAKIIFGTEQEIKSNPDVKNLGPDAIGKNLNFKKFKEIISSQKHNIKEVLMDQKVISGIGNIYSDEILWASKVNPLKTSKSLDEKQIKIIYFSMKKVLAKALKLRGTSISDYRDVSGEKGSYADYRHVYRKEGEPCPRCKTLIKRIKIKGRSAHYCPKCQKMTTKYI